MKKTFLLLSAFSLLLVSCGNEEIKTEEETSADTTEEVITETTEEIVEEVTTADFMLGKWQQIGRGCDSLGNNCTEMSRESFWEFKGDSVTWSSFTHPYIVSNDTLYIVDSPYKISGEMADTITWQAVKTNRFMKLVRN